MKFMMDVPFSDEELVDMCPWFTINKLTNPCSCKEYTRQMKCGNERTLILVDDACQTHGCEKEVDSVNQPLYSGSSPSNRST